MLKIAITGNIASGKSLFEKYLSLALKASPGLSDVKILCLDEVTKNLYLSSSSLKSFLLKNFNTDKKEEVSKVVFNNPSALRMLEEFIHPLILEKMNEFFLSNASSPLAFVSAATLFESGFSKYFDKIILISADKNIRLQRLMVRNNLDKEEALKRINSQTDDALKASKCDFIVNNSKEPALLEKAAKDIIKALL